MGGLNVAPSYVLPSKSIYLVPDVNPEPDGPTEYVLVYVIKLDALNPPVPLDGPLTPTSTLLIAPVGPAFR